jgi:hypothetical protein
MHIESVCEITFEPKPILFMIEIQAQSRSMEKQHEVKINLELETKNDIPKII